MAKLLRNTSMVILIALFASGCLAPLSNNFNARSLGTGKIGLDGGVVTIGGDVGVIPDLKIAVGLASDVDLGLQFDYASLGVFGKYSFINNKERGFSLAAVLGAGAVGNGFYACGGPVLGYKGKSFEPYIAGRFNFVHYGESEDFFEDLQWEAGNYTYLQFTLGSIFWINESIGLNIEGSALAGKLGLAEYEDFSAPSFVFLGGVKVRL